jgi:hypothetical protein
VLYVSDAPSERGTLVLFVCRWRPCSSWMRWKVSWPGLDRPYGLHLGCSCSLGCRILRPLKQFADRIWFHWEGQGFPTRPNRFSGFVGALQRGRRVSRRSGSCGYTRRS